MNCGLPVKYEGDSGTSRALIGGNFSFSASKSMEGAAIEAFRGVVEKNFEDAGWRKGCRGRYCGVLGLVEQQHCALRAKLTGSRVAFMLRRALAESGVGSQLLGFSACCRINIFKSFKIHLDKFAKRSLQITWQSYLI
jgi:hypothetical protein